MATRPRHTARTARRGGRNDNPTARRFRAARFLHHDQSQHAMKTLFAAAVMTAALAMTAQAWPAQPGALVAGRDISKFTGKWYSLDQDNREFTIERSSDGLKMRAPDLDCTIKYLQIHHDELNDLTADGQVECFDEGYAVRGTWLIRLFNSGYLAVVQHTTATSTMKDDGEDTKWKKENSTYVSVYSRRNEHPSE